MNGGVKDAIEYSGRVGTNESRCRGCDRIFWSKTTVLSYTNK